MTAEPDDAIAAQNVACTAYRAVEEPGTLLFLPYERHLPHC